ncbi:MAG: sn stearoyl-lipid 9-desaturase [Blastocatellia bacterium]|jgi:stearoyl-CoA desaturase (delta-9 desaturase)|nr:sn stearoyl-lipid 9-desaturase [Blastocatellia bacterium]
MQNEVTTSKDNTHINWHTATFMALFHVGAVAALFMFSWQALVAALVLWWISASLGVGMGFHRLLTHRGYKTPKLVEYFITVCGLLALEGGAINWVVTHRIHHAHTDAPGDPHTPREGGWWAHIGWMLKGTAQSHDQQTLARYAPDMVKDRFHVLANNFYWIPIIFLAIGLLALGGWSFVLWAVFFRITFNFHATWLVNSATHMWGRRRFATRDDSTNNWWVALLTFGEGWHNNHHAYPTAARHGLAWYEIDLNWWGIRTMQFLRLAKNVKLVRLAEVSAT